MMKLPMIVLLTVVFFTANVSAQYNGVPKETFEKIKTETEALLKDGRYMIQNSPTIVDNIPGWKGLKLEEYHYIITKEQNANGGGELKARVILYNPSAEQLVKWVINALLKAKLQASYNNIKLVINEVNGASGAQFPVRGIVYEDLYYNDNIYETYAFFDGVTVECCGFKIKTYTDDHKYTGQRVTVDQEKKYWKLTLDQIGENDVQKYGRIISTTREEYKAVCRDANTDGKNWLRIVRVEYQKAMKNDENSLIYAKIYSLNDLWPNENLKRFVQLDTCER